LKSRSGSAVSPKKLAPSCLFARGDMRVTKSGRERAFYGIGSRRKTNRVGETYGDARRAYLFQELSRRSFTGKRGQRTAGSGKGRGGGKARAELEREALRERDVLFIRAGSDSASKGQSAALITTTYPSIWETGIWPISP